MKHAPQTQTRLRYLVVISVIPILALLLSGTRLWQPSFAAALPASKSLDQFQSSPVDVQSPAATAPLLISEFRLRGPNGATDEFVEIYNNSDSSHTVNAQLGSTGYALACSSNLALNDGAFSIRFVIPNGTVIPARGHYLAVNSSGYSLSNYPAGSGTTAIGNITYTQNIPDNAGIALFDTSNLSNFNLANRIDAVGSDAELNPVYKEGTGYPALSPLVTDGSLFRKLPGGCTGSAVGNCNSASLVSTTAGPSGSTPQDTGDNAADFLHTDINGLNVGLNHQRHGAPGPENLSGPITGILDPGIVVSALDSSVSEEAAPNRVRNTTPGPGATSTFGTLTFRRRITNNVGQPITRLRFRVVDISTFPSIFPSNPNPCTVEPAPAGCVADLRVVSSSAAVVSVNDVVTCAPAAAPCNVTAQGTTLEETFAGQQLNGGGYNSSWSAGAVSLTTPLANGASINLQFQVGLQQTGVDRLFVIVEALPRSGPAITAVVRLSGPGAPTAPTTVQFNQATYSVQEDCTFTTVTVTRTGNISNPASVDFATTDGSANERFDYTTSLGAVNFSAGETSKQIFVLVTEDSFGEGAETATITLSNPTGAALGTPSVATVQITDDASEPATNAIDDTVTFVCQHYHDFLNRQHDDAGLAFWTNQIVACGPDQSCIDRKRVDVSTAFLLSIEFQQTGYKVIRMFKATFVDSAGRPRGLPRYRESLRDTQEIGRGVVVGQGNWEQQLADNILAFAREWVQRSEVVDPSVLPTTMTATEFVDKLFLNSGVTPTPAERSAAIAAFGAGGTNGRADALLSVIESGSVFNRQFNQAFVLMQYIGYLRRNPNDTPDFDYAGFDFWLTKLNDHSLPGEDVRDDDVALGRVRRAEMVRAFLTSGEYRGRFGS